MKFEVRISHSFWKGRNLKYTLCAKSCWKVSQIDCHSVESFWAASFVLVGRAKAFQTLILLKNVSRFLAHFCVFNKFCCIKWSLKSKLHCHSVRDSFQKPNRKSLKTVIYSISSFIEALAQFFNIAFWHCSFAKREFLKKKLKFSTFRIIFNYEKC